MGSKATNKKVIATDTQRRMASAIYDLRRTMKRWKTNEEKLVGKFRAEVGDVDVTLITANGDEVASITETSPTTKIGYDYEAYFRDHPDERKELEANYTTHSLAPVQVRVLTNWVETDVTPDQVVQTDD